MNISGIQSSQPAAQPAKASESKQIQAINKQILAVQEQIRTLAEDDKMEPKAKAEKKKELEGELTTLKQQLMQAKMEEKKEEVEKPTAEPQKLSPEEERRRFDSFDKQTMQNLITSEKALDSAESKLSIKTNFKQQIRIAHAEIKADGGRGASTKSKYEKIAVLEGRIAAIDVSAAKDTNKALAYATDAEEKTEKEDEEQSAVKGTVTGQSERKEEKTETNA